jgi:hypothetical protein
MTAIIRMKRAFFLTRTEIHDYLTINVKTTARRRLAREFYVGQPYHL